MKKLFFLLFTLISFVGFSQTTNRFFKETRYTNYMETSRMVWNNYRNEYDFFPNDDKMIRSGEWEFTLDLSEETGFIKSGEIIYTVKDIQLKETESGTLVLMNVRNQKVNEDMFMIVGSPGDMFMIAIYRWDLRTVYYMTYQ